MDSKNCFFRERKEYCGTHHGHYESSSANRKIWNLRYRKTSTVELQKCCGQ